MPKVKDITNQKFGRLTAIKYLGQDEQCSAIWLCKCDCGNIIKIDGRNLRRGNTKSCGCLRKELNTTHGKSNSKLFNIWTGMKQRCYDEHCKSYKDYGGRGIVVCNDWLNDFQIFHDWAMNNDYQEGLTIDRIDNNKGYSPKNCHWATRKQQNRNTRKNKSFTINGETHCLSEWCEIYNINYKKVHCRIYRNHWTIEKALELI